MAVVDGDDGVAARGHVAVEHRVVRRRAALPRPAVDRDECGVAAGPRGPEQLHAKADAVHVGDTDPRRVADCAPVDVEPAERVGEHERSGASLHGARRRHRGLGARSEPPPHLFVHAPFGARQRGERDGRERARHSADGEPRPAQGRAAERRRDEEHGDDGRGEQPRTELGRTDGQREEERGRRGDDDPQGERAGRDGEREPGAREPPAPGGAGRNGVSIGGRHPAGE
jgi:hypothetical protein